MIRMQLERRAQRKDSSPPGSLPAPGGRDPLVHRGTDKGRFFRGDWRQTWPRDFEVYRGGESLPAQRSAQRSANSTSSTSTPPEEFGGLGDKLRRIRDKKRAEKEAGP